ncbi:MAG: transcriptional repressor LexA [Patescibacteria group bacterium]
MVLTTKQQKFYELLKDFFKEKRVAPKLIELKDWLAQHNWEVSSLNSLTQYLQVLEDEGKIERGGKMRGIKLLEGYDTVSVPILATVASCGSPTNLLDENVEDYAEVSRTIVKNPSKVFLFKVEGDSMDEAGMEEGDYVLVEKTDDISDRDIVLATIDGCCSVKRFRKSADTITLLSESTNPSNKPIYLHATDDFVIAGKVLHVLKN